MLTLATEIADRGPVGKRRARIEGLVYKVIEHSTVDLVGSRFHGVVEISAARLPVLGIKIAGLDGDFLHRINARLITLVELTPHAVRRILTINADGLRARWHSVNSKRVVIGKGGARQQGHGLQRSSNVAEAGSGAQRKARKR